jgi:hypothetical protein
MRTLLMLFVLLLLIAPLSAPGAASSKKKSAVPANATRSTATRTVRTGWNSLATKRSDLCDIAYRVEGGGITLRVRNLSKERQARVRYAVRCKVRGKDGAWKPFETYPAEGLTMTIGARDEVDKHIRTSGVEVKELTMEVSASEAE